jgi:hypothetical protein
MFESERAKVLPDMDAAVRAMKMSAASLMEQAVGVTKDDFSQLLDEFDRAFQQWMTDSSALDFSDQFAAAPLITELGQLVNAIQKLVDQSRELHDHVIIEPDPISAAQLPDDYTIPTVPPGATPPPIDAAYADLCSYERSVHEALTDFRRQVGEPLAEGRSLVEAFQELKDAAEVFANGSIHMAIATRDPRLQVEQQTNLHEFGNGFNAVRDALRARLMRAGDFEREMIDAIGSFQAAIERVMKLAESASTAEVPTVVAAPVEVDLEEDEVSREFRATAFAIEEMAARLKQISDQVDTAAILIEEEEEEETVPEQPPESPDALASPDGAGAPPPAEPPEEAPRRRKIDLQAQEGTLPAFVIAHANPILEAAAAILKRAGQVTSEILQQCGRIENDKLIIRCAQELSEAAALLLIVAEILIGGQDNDAHFKVITAARIIKASVSSLVAQVLVKGGDPQGIMNQNVRIVVHHTDKIIVKCENIVLEQAREQEAKKKAAPNKMIKRLNLSTRINDVRKQMQDDERKLKQFRKRF